MKVLFITRTYPPLVGGMEKFASDFFNNYRRIGEIDLLANSRGKKSIIPFLLQVMMSIMFNGRKYDVVHLYDAVLFPLIPFIRLFSKAKISFTVNGLDIVYSSFGYQKVMPLFLRKADKVIAISRYTMAQCEARGIPREKLMTIPIGVIFEAVKACSDAEKAALFSKFDIPFGRKVLLTVGRLVKRKGHAWFIKNVIVKLPQDHIYLVAGLGPEFEEIKNLVQALNLAGRVYLLGQISDEEKNCLYQIADLFIMPNVSIRGDQEGFGIVVLEAGSFGLPVIATNLEGIKDVVIDQKTGRLLEEGDTESFVHEIMNFHPDRSSIADSLASSFNWEGVVQRYYKEFEKMSTR